MYNYSKYREALRWQSFISFPTGKTYNSKEEIEAKKEYNEINIDELEVHLLSIIDKCQNLRDENSKNSYDSQINRINNTYEQPQKRFNLNKYKSQVSRENRQNRLSLYIKAKESAISQGITDTNKINRHIAKEAIKKIQSRDSYLSKLIFITDFESIIKDSMFWEDLYSLVYSKTKISFKDLFNKESNFKEIVSILVKNKVIEKSNDEYLWKGAINDAALKDKKLLCTLGYILHFKNYFKSNINSQITNALNQFFINIKITEQHYGKVKREFEDETVRLNDPYFKHFSFIPKK